MFFQWKFPGLWVNFLVLLSHIPYKTSEELPLGCLFDVFTGLRLSIPTFCISGYDDKYRVSQKLPKKGNTTLLISSSNYAKRHINVCSGDDLCSPVLAIFLKHPVMKVGFDVRIFVV